MTKQIKERMTDEGLLEEFKKLWYELQYAKPDLRNERARRFAVTITEFEKVMAYFHLFVVDNVQ